MVTIKDFKNGKVPSTLYHMTRVENLASIMKYGLLHEVDKDKKCFSWCDDCVYMFTDLKHMERICDLYFYLYNINEMFKNKEDVSDIVEKYVILRIDCSKLDKEYIGIDDMIVTEEVDDKVIDAFTYSKDITPECIEVETYMTRVYKKEEIIEEFFN